MNASINHYGYACINLRHNGNRKYGLVHRLVAESFIPNPNGLPEINHIDCNKLNNCVENLEWCDRAANMLHAKKHGLIKPRMRAVIRSDGEIFSSIKCAARSIGVNPTAISHSLVDGFTVRGYHFSYAGDDAE